MSTGIITTFAGSGSPGYSGDNGAATAAAFDNTWAVAVDASDNVYIVDSTNNRIRKVTIAPTTAPTSYPSTLSPSLSPNSVSVITAFAGTGSGSYSGDNGQATSASLFNQVAVALDSSGRKPPICSFLSHLTLLY